MYFMTYFDQRGHFDIRHCKNGPQIEWTELEASNQSFLCSVEPVKSNAKVIVRKDSYS